MGKKLGFRKIGMGKNIKLQGTFYTPAQLTENNKELLQDTDGEEKQIPGHLVILARYRAMQSWTALTRHIGMKAAFRINHI